VGHGRRHPIDQVTIHAVLEGRSITDTLDRPTIHRRVDAAVRIRVDAPYAAAATYTLHTNEALGHEISHAGVRVGLVTVAPHPTADKKPQPGEYRVTLSAQSK
jgi:hypothetical protein